MSNKFIEKLYDLADSKDDQGLSVFDEQKLRRGLEKNQKLGSRNKDAFKVEPKFFTCRRYDPCPICDKCLNKASHLYVSCQTCLIPICVHTYRNRSMMIKRKNFTITPGENTIEALKELSIKFPTEVLK